ncbi:EF-hand domain-containing protein [Caerostris darwini]|uniref:EF-hand domain-containing protein n=1 Tax=Caerostris darwini TaxID=1538125 RepID=A0AAV4UAB6_9ARAC|nr:EF-hand domain-containing protein [Caerostris darwini]
MSDLRKEVADYLKDYKINEIFSYLSKMLFFFKPENPLDFMAQVLLDLKSSFEKGKPIDVLYPEESLRAYFRLLDPSDEGHITWVQLKSAMQVLGIRDVEFPILKQGPVTVEVFLDMCQKNFEQGLTISEK